MAERTANNPYQKFGGIRLMLTIDNLEDFKVLSGGVAVFGTALGVANEIVKRAGFSLPRRLHLGIRGVSLALAGLGLAANRYYEGQANLAAEEIENRLIRGDRGISESVAERIDKKERQGIPLDERTLALRDELRKQSKK